MRTCSFDALLATLLKVGRKRLTAAEAWHLALHSLHLSDVDGGDAIPCVHQQVMPRIDVPFPLAR